MLGGEGVLGGLGGVADAGRLVVMVVGGVLEGDVRSVVGAVGALVVADCILLVERVEMVLRVGVMEELLQLVKLGVWIGFVVGTDFIAL